MNGNVCCQEGMRMCPFRILASLYITLTVFFGITHAVTIGNLRPLAPLLIAVLLAAYRLKSGRPLWLCPDELLSVLPFWCGLAANRFGLHTAWFPWFGLLTSLLCLVGACRTTAGVIARGRPLTTALLLAPPLLLVFAMLLAGVTGGAERMHLSALSVQVALAFGGVPVSWLAWPPQASAAASPAVSAD